jgi:hypothetical protein
MSKMIYLPLRLISQGRKNDSRTHLYVKNVKEIVKKVERTNEKKKCV